MISLLTDTVLYGEKDDRRLSRLIYAILIYIYAGR